MAFFIKNRGLLARRAAFGLLCALSFAMTPAQAASVVGYFNADYLVQDSQKNSNGQFNVEQVSLIFQHQTDFVKFLFELEFKTTPSIQDTGDGTGANASDNKSFGEFSVERAYSELTFNPAFDLRVGKDLTPTIWLMNHYPNLVMTITRPQILHATIPENNTGIKAFGNLGMGFNYHAWVGNSSPKMTAGAIDKAEKANHPPASSYGARLGWEGKLADAEISADVIGMTVFNEEDPNNAAAMTTYHPSAVEMSLAYHNFLLWTEVSQKSSDLSGAYAVLSYTFDVGKEGQLSPFFMYDSMKDNEKTANKNDSAVVKYGYGLNYKPIPVAVVKLEVLDTPSVNNNPQETQYATSFTYFFN